MNGFIGGKVPQASTQSSGFRCLKCDVPFRKDTPTNVPVPEWFAFIQAMKCPFCGASAESLSFGMGLREQEDRALRIEGSENERAVNWRNRAEIGSSSITIFRFFIADYREYPAHPHDLADLRRCIRLLEHVPEWKPRVPELAVLSPVWARLANEWEHLTALFRQEAPELNKDAPQASELLNYLIHPEYHVPPAHDADVPPGDSV